MNNKNNDHLLEQSALRKGKAIADFNQSEQQWIRELSEGCRMEEEEVIKALFDDKNLSTETQPSLLENGSFKILNLSPEFYKLKKFPSLNLLPNLEELYLAEDYRKTRANRIKKIELSNCSSLKIVSIMASKLTELTIDLPNLHTLILRASMLKKSEFNDLNKLINIELDDIQEFDMNQLNLKWSILETLSIKRMSQDIPIEELANIQRLTLNYIQDVSVDRFDKKKISIEAPNLEFVDFINTNIKELYLDKCSNLKALSLTEKNLVKATFDYKNIEKLDLNVSWQFLGTAQLNECKQLKELRLVNYHGLTLKIQLEKLHRVYFLDPEIKTLDVTLCPQLRYLGITGRVADVEQLRTHCEYIELFLNYARVKTLDISASQDSAYLEYSINGIETDRIRLICRDTQLERLHWLKKDFSNIKTIVSSSKDLDQMVDHYNYDQGNEFLEWVINHPNCDKGTALKIYWRLGVSWYSQYENESQVPSHAKEGYKLIKKIERLCMSDHFRKYDIAYEPEKDFIDPYTDVMVKERIPSMMFLPVKPKGIKSILKGWFNDNK